jgi:hypothetical protein
MEPKKRQEVAHQRAGKREGENEREEMDVERAGEGGAERICKGERREGPLGRVGLGLGRVEEGCGRGENVRMWKACKEEEEASSPAEAQVSRAHPLHLFRSFLL